MSLPTAIGPRLELLDVGPPDPVGAVLVELRRVDPADVVRLEDLRVEHGGHRTRLLAEAIPVFGSSVVDSGRLPGSPKRALKQRIALWRIPFASKSGAQFVRRRIQRPEFMSLA